MEIKGKCRAGIRRRKLDIQNSETQEWDSWNSPFRLKRQSRARVAPYIRESCEMHEMMKRRSRFGATVNQTTSTQTKGKSRQQGYPIDSTSLYLWCFWVVCAANERLIWNRRRAAR